MFFPSLSKSFRSSSLGGAGVFVLSILFGSMAHSLFYQSAFAWVSTRTSDGLPVVWDRSSTASSFRMELVGNSKNRSGLSSTDVQAAVVRGLQRWERASGGVLDFDYWQGTDGEAYDTDSDFDGISSIHFASAAPRDSVLPANVLGMTQVWFDTRTGEILETDIVLNDLQASFTTDATDTTGYGNGRPSTIYSGTQLVYIENVLTHELGHALGLSHSGGLQSTMLFLESPEQAKLGCDDQLAIRALYPLSSDAKKRGSLSGTVVGPNGKAIFGAQVTAVSSQRGVALASVLTGKEGEFRFDALEPGSYFLVIEPFLGGAEALPEFYSEVNSKVCSAGRTDFVRTAAMEPGSEHDLQLISVSAGKKTRVGTLEVGCEERAEATRSSGGVVHPSGADLVAGFGFLDRLDWGDERIYRVGMPGADGAIRVHALGYSLFSPVKPILALLDSSGNVVQGAGVSIRNPVYSGDSGYENFDGELRASGLNPGAQYFVRVRGSYVDSFKVPGGPDAIDAEPFFVLSVTRTLKAPALSAELTDDARCSMTEGFARYASPKSKPQRRSTEASAGGGCAPAAQASRGGQRGTAQRSTADSVFAALGSFMPLAFALVGLRISRGRRLTFRLKSRSPSQ